MTQRRYLLFSLYAGALAGLLMIGYLIWADYQQVLVTNRIRSHDYAVILETRLEATFRRAESQLRTVARYFPREALRKQAVPIFGATLNADLDLHLRDFPELAGLRIFDDAGNQLYSSNRATTPLGNVVDRDYFVHLREHPQDQRVFSAVNISRTTGRPTLVMAKALLDAQGIFRGIAIASIELEFFENLFHSLDVGPHGVIAVYRLDDFTRVVRWPVGDAKYNAPLSPNSRSQAIFASGQKTATVDFPSSTDGEIRIYTLRALSEYPFFVSVGMARRDALAEWQVRAWAVALIALALISLLLALSHRLWRAQAAQVQISQDLARSEERLRLLFERATEGIVIISDSGQLAAVNAAFAQMHGYSIAEVMHHDFAALLTHQTLQTWPEKLHNFRAGESLVFEVEHRHKEGHIIVLEASGSLITVDGERLVQLFYRDIGERKLAMQMVSQLAYHDPLTKLANRTLLADRLLQSMLGSKRSGRYGALLVLDLDNFKPLNDKYGHSVGDLLLLEVTQRLQQCVRQMDTVARFGGDEFVVLLDDLESNEALATSQSEAIAEKLRKRLAAPYQITMPSQTTQAAPVITHHCSASIGCVLFLGEQHTQEEIFTRADSAMYQAKNAGRNTVQFYAADSAA